MRQPPFKQLIARMGSASQTPGPGRFLAVPVVHLPPGVWAGAVLVGAVSFLCIILLPQLLHQTDILLLHIFKGLACDVHLREESFFFLK